MNSLTKENAQVNAQVGIHLRIKDIEFTGAIGLVDGKKELAAVARNIDIEKLLKGFLPEIEAIHDFLPDELSALNLVVDALYLGISTEDNQKGGRPVHTTEFYSLIELSQGTIIRKKQFEAKFPDKYNEIWKQLGDQGWIEKCGKFENKARVTVSKEKSAGGPKNYEDCTEGINDILFPDESEPLVSKNQFLKTFPNQGQTIWTDLCKRGCITEDKSDKNRAIVSVKEEDLPGKLAQTPAINNPDEIGRILFPRLTLGSKTLPLAALEFKLTEKKNDFLEVAFILHGNFKADEKVTVGDEKNSHDDAVAIKSFNLKFSYYKNNKKNITDGKNKQASYKTQWKLSGGLSVLIYGLALELSASYDQQNNDYTIKLESLFRNRKILPELFSEIKGIDEEKSKDIWNLLIGDDLLDKNNSLTEKFKPSDSGFSLPVSIKQRYAKDFPDIEKNIIDCLQKPPPLIVVPNLLNIGDPAADKVADLGIRRLTLTIERTGKNTAWDFSATGDFNIYNLALANEKIFELQNGTIKIHTRNGEKGLTFDAENAGVKPFNMIPGIPSYLANALEVKFKKFEIITKDKEGWQCSAAIDLSLLANSEQPDETEKNNAVQGNLNVTRRTDPDPPPKHNLIDTVKNIGLFPKSGIGVKSEIRISSKKGVTFTLENERKGIELTPPAEIFTKLLPKELKESDEFKKLEERLSLGTSYFNLEKIGIHIGDQFSCSITIAFGLPDNLNGVFFGDPDYGLIRCYDPARLGKTDENGKKDDNLLRATLEVGTEGIAGYLESGSIIGIPNNIDQKLKDRIKEGIVEEKEHITLYFDKLFPDQKEEFFPDQKEEFGTIRITKPKLKIDVENATFKASGGYEVLSDQLMIPIRPLFEILVLVFKPKDTPEGDLDDIVKLLPPGIPVQSLYFFKDGKFDLDNLEDWLRRGLPEDARKAFALPAPFKHVAEDIGGQILNRLPDAFKEYLNIVLPKGFNFDIDISGDATFSVNIEVPSQKDDGTGQFADYIQLLIPVPGGLGTLYGIRLKKLGLGTALGNTCIRLDLTARLDIFDLVQLGACFILEDKDKIKDENLRLMLPDRKKLGQRYEAQNLIMFIFYETVIPIPVPVFYDKLYSSYFGLEGMESEFRLRFSKPKVSLGGLFQDLIKLFKAFSTEEAAFALNSYPYREPSKETLAEGTNWIFGAGPMYTQLPCLMGYEEVDGVKQNIVIGTKETYYFDLFELIRLGGNSLKFFVFNQIKLIKAFAARDKKAKDREPVELWKLPVQDPDDHTFTYKRPLNYLIEYLPVERRAGFKKIKLFYLFDFDAAWAFTTPDEFEQIVYPKMLQIYAEKSGPDKIPPSSEASSPNELLDLFLDKGAAVTLPLELAKPLIPQESEKFKEGSLEKAVSFLTVDEDQGAVLFLRGGLDIARQISLEGAIGLMLSEQKGFRTGLSLKGKFFNWVETASFFFLKINPNDPQEVVKILGTTFLKVFEREVLKGHIEVTNADLKFQGMLDLFPSGFPVQLKGFANGHINSEKFFLDAGCGLQLGAFRAGAQLKVHIDEVQQLLQADLVFANSLLHIRVFHQQVGEQEWLNADLVANAFNILALDGHLRFKREARRLQLMGSTSLSIPFLDLLRVQLDYAGELNLDAGFMSLSAQLTGDSYILSRNCRPTGGAAFSVWFPQAPQVKSRAGDFALTIGGYHPNFKVPDHYPRVPRVGIQWEIDRYTHIRGEAYFALTPKAIMAGVKLDLVYQRGNIRAWFTAYADFLCQWSPLYFAVDIGVSVGASYTLRVGARILGKFVGVVKTFSISIKAQLHLWGPPTGGRVDIKLPIVTIGINFGAKRGPLKELKSWDEFKDRFLLKNKEKSADAIIQIVPLSGVIAVEDVGENKTRWVARADELSFTVTTKVPVSRICKKTPAQKEPELIYPDSSDNVKFIDIKPLKQENICSSLTVELVGDENSIQNFEIEHLSGNVPAALWGRPIENPDADRADLLDSTNALISDRITGLNIFTKDAKEALRDGVTPEIVEEYLEYSEIEGKEKKLPQLETIAKKVQQPEPTELRNLLKAIRSAREIREAVIKKLQRQPWYHPEDYDLEPGLSLDLKDIQNEWRHCPRILETEP